ncbi:hypothetical protein OFR22_06310 [Brachyspira hyodysenteriae]|uniref:Uncharacterized protein n=1 Tax=Brachyspira hyodysenteriae ATCC 27164 TaxID=1266923 RepID=A0A3B6VSX8_BRAHO|nr:hypothetical protein [Brachyspira hyodysenteriae]ANN63955.1 hypothetical protein BHYOB78_08760 [Brachyspira hyodysenteriae ATCC 27164]MCZ9851372.1 hypothetical protein [Brachyspira hyodysenteriae]MCZ9859901.1 hypothetical protein [Brachyspira hyodysenteriae]MCZ9870411.1 hypothetical protein [Brachyspira hyodysenteriae]MCZ9874552.1 hypothetical protein [Brachyspira hyodysenteriae]
MIMGTLGSLNSFDNYNTRITKEEVRDKIYKDSNIEKKIKEGVEDYLDLSILKMYSDNAYSEYDYLNNYMLITTEIFEEGYVICDIHIDVNMKIYDYMPKDDNKNERYLALDNIYLMGLNLKFSLKEINDDIENIELRYFNIYGISDNLHQS